MRFLEEAWDRKKNCFDEKLVSELKDTLKYTKNVLEATKKQIQGLT
jgi:hypothetical protein